MGKFQCSKCQKIFEAEGKKKEWQDPIYGHCWKRIAKCPVCGNESEEYWPKRSLRKKSEQENYPFPKCACGG
jgi:hypothetical protein